MDAPGDTAESALRLLHRASEAIDELTSLLDRANYKVHIANDLVRVSSTLTKVEYVLKRRHLAERRHGKEQSSGGTDSTNPVS